MSFHSAIEGGATGLAACLTNTVSGCTNALLSFGAVVGFGAVASGGLAAAADTGFVVFAVGVGLARGVTRCVRGAASIAAGFVVFAVVLCFAGCSFAGCLLAIFFGLAGPFCFACFNAAGLASDTAVAVLAAFIFVGRAGKGPD